MPWYSYGDHRPGMVTYTYNHRIWEMNVGGLPKFKANLDYRENIQVNPVLVSQDDRDYKMTLSH